MGGPDERASRSSAVAAGVPDGVGVVRVEVLCSWLGVGVAEREGVGQAGPSTATSLTCGPFPAAGSVMTTIPKYTLSPQETLPGSCATLLV
ncbi:hypothetical protein [Nonomuraea sp. NPDC049784]|uniref:hypothetical protein n=1 Tax=Nonomuraea sp. NPDC049784 TaxID=3154361 RepID=UPI0033CE4DDB